MMRLPRSPNPIIGFLYLLLLAGSVAALVFLNQLAWFFLLLLLALLLLLLWWLFYRRADAPVYPPEAFFIQDEVIIRGPALEVARAVDAASKWVTLTELDRIDFGELSDAVRNCLGDCSRLDYKTLVIILYKIEGTETSVAAAIRAINRVVGPGSDVRSEPNWLAGRPYDPSGNGVDPWDPTGSGTDPWDPTGSGADPWDPTGSGERKLKAADADLFMEQWAFKHIGLHDREDDFKGRNVQIGIFDTWPEELIGEDSVAKPLFWVSEPSLLEPEIIDHFRLLEPEARDYDLSSHGLFSAGLAHAIAPEAKIQIYRVLNKNNKGALFSIMRATFEFILDFTSKKTADDDQKLGAVINMSLGIRVPPEAAGIILPAEVLSFRDLLLAARCAGIVVVAASGNNSAKTRLPEPANLPANWPENMGAAASNFYRKMSCFSNQGNIAAPGGDGVQSKFNPDGCIGAIGLCEPDRDCEYAIIGPVLREDGNTGFAFWNGTSFSSPMVAALAACVVEKGQGRFSPDKVRSILECGATDPDPDGYLGAGIINIPRTMDCCPVDEAKPEVPDQRPDYDDKEQSAV